MLFFWYIISVTIEVLDKLLLNVLIATYGHDYGRLFLLQITLEQSGAISSWMVEVDQCNCDAAYESLQNNTTASTN